MKSEKVDARAFLKDLKTPAELAKVSDISRSTIGRLFNRGLIPYVVVGAKTRKCTLEQLLEGFKRAGEIDRQARKIKLQDAGHDDAAWLERAKTFQTVGK